MSDNVIDLFSWSGERGANKVERAQHILSELLKGIAETLKQAKTEPAVLDGLIAALQKAAEPVTSFHPISAI